MAIQHFIQGGYTGKLGQTVGERWKGKFYVRAYVKTPNPDTPNQRVNRDLFKTAVSLAQEAMKINGKDGLWDTSKMNEFTKRTQQALKHLREGWSEEQAFPLYPDGYIPPKKFEVVSYYMGVTEDELLLTYSIDTSMDEGLFEIDGKLFNANDTVRSDFNWEWEDDPNDREIHVPLGRSITEGNYIVSSICLWDTSKSPAVKIELGEFTFNING